VLATVGNFERISLRLTQPLMRGRATRLDQRITLERITQALSASEFGIELNRDRYAVIRLGLEGAFTSPQGMALRMDTSLDAGLGGRDDASTAASGLPTSRQGASAHFTKITFGGDVQPSPAGEWRTDWHTRGQLAFGRALFMPEAFGLVGADLLSAFDPGSLNADQGIATRLQVGRRIRVGSSDPDTNLLAYGFIAAASGHVFAATVVQTASIQAAAAGLGMRIEHLADENRSQAFALEVSNGRSNQPSQRRPARVSASVALRL
jgi:hemolysin activation/secretion protein